MIIGLAHRAQVGKDTVGEYLVKQYGFVRHAFADPLKEEVNAILSVFGRRYREEDKEILRPLLIAWGEYRRHQNPGYWSNFLMGDIKWDLARETIQAHHVVTDVRYPNEADAIRKLGGIIVRINRDTGLDIPSEAIMDNYVADYEVDNNGDVLALLHAIDLIVEGE